jgi:hypothetical protein
MPPGLVFWAGVGQRLKLFVYDNHLIELGAVPLETDP